MKVLDSVAASKDLGAQLESSVTQPDGLSLGEPARSGVPYPLYLRVLNEHLER